MKEKIEDVIQLIEAGQVEEGLTQLSELEKTANHENKFLIADCYIKWGLLDEAKAIIDELLLFYPDEGQLYIYAAEILLESDDEEEAINYLDQIDEADPSYVQALVLMADLYQAQGLDEVAEHKLLQAKKQAPEEILIDFGLGEFYLSQGEYAKAIPYYKRVIAEEEVIADRNVNLPLAEALSMHGEFEEALTYYEKGLSDKVEIHALFGFGFTAYQLERYEIAIQKWEELKELDPEYASLFLYLAKAYEQIGALEDAYNTGIKGLEVDEFNKEMHLYCGKMSLKLQNEKQAENHLREAIAIDPGYIEAGTTLTKLLIHQERFEETVELITHISEYEEITPQFEWDLAKAKNELEDFSDALNHYRHAYTSFKDNIEFLEEYSVFLLEEGQVNDAKAVLARILELDPTQTHVAEELLRLEY